MKRIAMVAVISFCSARMVCAAGEESAAALPRIDNQTSVDAAVDRGTSQADTDDVVSHQEMLKYISIPRQGIPSDSGYKSASVAAKQGTSNESARNLSGVMRGIMPGQSGTGYDPHSLLQSGQPLYTGNDAGQSNTTVVTPTIIHSGVHN